MGEYKAGALSAFLSGDLQDDVVGHETKKSTKKRKKVESQETVEAELLPVEKAAKKEPAIKERTESSSVEKRKRGRSYGSLMTDDEKQRTIFVGNLPIDISKKVLKRLFSPCGTIESMRIRSAVPGKPHMTKKAAVITGKLSDGLDTLNAYVKFKCAQSVQEALNLNGTILNDRHIQVDSCMSSKRYDDKRTIFLGNVPFDAKEDRLYEHFSDCGDIEKVRLVRNRATGEGKGFGFVVFKDSSSVSFALKLNGEKFENRDLRVTRVMKKQKLSKAASSSSRPTNKKKQQGEFKTKKRFRADEATTSHSVDRKKPSKKIRGLIKKRRSQKVKRSYMSTV